MTVEPGFGGQKFMSDMMAKVAAIRREFPDGDVQGNISDAIFEPRYVKFCDHSSFFLIIEQKYV